MEESYGETTYWITVLNYLSLAYVAGAAGEREVVEVV